MKKYLILMPLLIILSISTTAYAQYTNEYLKNACCKYETSLKSEHPAIVKSVLIHVMWIYSHYPETDFSKISDQLNVLKTNGETQEIRMIATFAVKYLNNEEDLSWMQQFDYEQIHTYFTMVYASNENNITIKL